VGEAKQKAIKHRRIRDGEFPCVYCGGVDVGREPDHMPPRILFKGKQRPNDLVFPSCSACNRGSAALDTIVSWLGRSYPDGTSPSERREVKDLGSSMITNYPEVASAFFREPAHRLQLTPEQKMGLGDYTPVNVGDPYVHRCIEYFGAKFGMALHWKTTGRCLPSTGRIYPQWFTNAQAVMGGLPDGIFEVFPKPEPLRQGSLHTSGRFEHASAVDGDYSTHLAVFGRSFLVLAFVAPTPDHSFAESGALECGPGCLQSGYPYGLPRLSGSELAARFHKMRGRAGS
jgi:hypothetical protein